MLFCGGAQYFNVSMLGDLANLNAVAIIISAVLVFVISDPIVSR